MNLRCDSGAVPGSSKKGAVRGSILAGWVGIETLVLVVSVVAPVGVKVAVAEQRTEYEDGFGAVSPSGHR
ncbi:hypothetical protein GCM10018775_88260 [Streptomyces umbrinus]|nr:hypothetical protein GCM10018775_88260 [Streptomyces umbrinus]